MVISKMMKRKKRRIYMPLSRFGTNQTTEIWSNKIIHDLVTKSIGQIVTT